MFLYILFNLIIVYSVAHIDVRVAYTGVVHMDQKEHLNLSWTRAIKTFQYYADLWNEGTVWNDVRGAYTGLVNMDQNEELNFFWTRAIQTFLYYADL